MKEPEIIKAVRIVRKLTDQQTRIALVAVLTGLPKWKAVTIARSYK